MEASASDSKLSGGFGFVAVIATQYFRNVHFGDRFHWNSIPLFQQDAKPPVQRLACELRCEVLEANCEDR